MDYATVLQILDSAVRLMTLAAEAALAPVGDPTTLRRLHRAIDRF